MTVGKPRAGGNGQQAPARKQAAASGRRQPTGSRTTGSRSTGTGTVPARGRGGGTGQRGRAAAVARLLRRLTGVREELLGKVPAERTRYTALGGVMICTACTGGLSMYFALAEIVGRGGVSLAPLAILWGTFVLMIDCWLVSSSAGGHLRARLAALLPRLVIALFLGFLIAVPLELRIFQGAVTAEVQELRQQQVQTLTSELEYCNAGPSAPTAQLAADARPDCRGLVLNLGLAGAGAQQQLSGDKAQAAALQQETVTESSQLSLLQAALNTACNEDAPSCLADHRAVAAYQEAHPVQRQENELGILDEDISNLEGTVGTAADSDDHAVSEAIASRVQATAAAQGLAPDAPITLGEQLTAMSALAGGSTYISAASWFIRVFFMLIDSLPVLVKLFGGRTRYDELAAIQGRYAVRAALAAAKADFTDRVALRRIRSQADLRKVAAELDALRRHAERKLRLSLNGELARLRARQEQPRRPAQRIQAVPSLRGLAAGRAGPVRRDRAGDAEDRGA